MVSSFKLSSLKQRRPQGTLQMGNESDPFQDHGFDLLLCENHLGSGLTFTGLVFMFMIMITSLFGNTLVCIASVKFSYLHSYSEHFIVSLALSDIMVAVFVLPFDVIYWITFPRWPLGGYVCNLWNASFFLFLTASVLNLTAISIDRYLAVVYPLRYTIWMTSKVAKSMIASVWLYSFSIAILLLFLLDPPKDETYSFDLNPFVHGFLLIGNVIFPFLIMMILYFKIYTIAKGHAQRAGVNTMTSSNRAPPVTSSRTTSFGRELRIAKMLGIVVLCFVICWLPFEIINVVILIDEGVATCAVELVDTVTCWLAYLHSSLNPLLYAFTGSEFRRAFRKLLCRREWRTGAELSHSQSNAAKRLPAGSVSDMKPQEISSLHL